MSDADVILDEVVEEGRLVTLAEVKTMLEGAAEVREDMTYEQKIALEHARRFARLDEKKAQNVVKGVQKIVPEAEQKYAVRIADLLPVHPDDVRSIFQKARLELSDEQVEKIIDVVDENYVA